MPPPPTEPPPSPVAPPPPPPPKPLYVEIAGGDRSVGEESAFTLNGCEETNDPDDPTARCEASGDCGTSLLFTWSCVRTETLLLSPPPAPTASFPGPPPTPPPPALPAAHALLPRAPPPPMASPLLPPPSTPPLACGMPLPGIGMCAWAIAAAVLSPATYEFALNVSHASTGKWGTSLVRVVVAPKDIGPLPSVDIAPLGFPKHSPNAKLRLQADATYPDGSGGAFEYLWTSSPYLELADADISSTGSGGNNLVLLPGALAAGGLYRFTLSVTDDVSGATAFAALDVFVNSPPQGGGLYVKPTCGDGPCPDAGGAIALEPIALGAYGWTDEPDDMPLMYSFAYGEGEVNYQEKSITSAVVTQIRGLSLLPNATCVLPRGNWSLILSIHDTWGGAATVLRDLPVAPKQVNKAVVEEQLATVLAEVQAGDAASAAQQAGALAAALNEARQTGVDLSTPAAHQRPLLLLQPHSCLRRVTCLPT